MDKLLSDSAETEISEKVMDILRAYHISNWHSEPYHQNQNPAEWRYRTIKSWTNPVFYASHDQHFPLESEERAPFWVGFGEHCGDAMTHKLLDKMTQKIIYRSAVRPITKANPNHRLAEDGGQYSSDQEMMMLIHLTSSLCLNLILMT